MYIFITCLHIRFLELPTQDVPSKGDIQFTNSKVSNELYIWTLVDSTGIHKLLV